ncbi:MAG: MCE family protein [Chlorobi bacterium]|nr:MCE family protein [Chlorobiota bacterium]
MHIRKEYKAAAFVLTAIVLFVWGYNFLKGKDLLKNYNIYYAVFDNVDGIDNSTQVKMRGLPVGSIQSMQFRQGDRKIVLALNIDREYFIPKDSRVKITGSGILGSKNLEIELGYSPEPAPSGDTLQSVQSGGLSEMMGSAQEQLESLISNTNQLIRNLNSVLSDSNKVNLAATLENTNRLTAELHQLTLQTEHLIRQNQQSLHNTMQHVEKASQDLETVSGKLAKQDIDQLMQNLTESTDRLNKILKDLQQGKGTAGKMLKDEQMYRELNRTLADLDALLRDLKENPKRYVHFSVFGKKDKKK